MHLATWRRSPGTFFALVFTLASPFWILGTMTGSPEGMPMDLPAAALMFPCPLVAALILAYREGKAHQARLLLRRVIPKASAG